MVAASLLRGQAAQPWKIAFMYEWRIENSFTKWNDQSFLRVSIQGYNTQEDIDTFLNALKKFLVLQGDWKTPFRKTLGLSK